MDAAAAGIASGESDEEMVGSDHNRSGDEQDEGIIDDAVVGSDDGGGSDLSVVPSPSPSVADDAYDPSSTSGTSEGSAVGSDVEPADVLPSYPLEIDGVEMVCNVFKHKTRPNRSHIRVIAKCKKTSHGGRCDKYRGTGTNQTMTHGPWEPVAFLLAWHRGGRNRRNRAAHKSFVPTDAAVAAVHLELKERGIIVPS